jgi:hypothetical protein
MTTILRRTTNLRAESSIGKDPPLANPLSPARFDDDRVFPWSRRPVASMPLMSDEIRQVPAGEADAHEVWQRLTDEPDVRDIETWTDDEVDGWIVEVGVQEFFRDDPLGRELRDRLQGALREVEGVSQVAEYDNESWLVSGDPSGRDLTLAAAVVVYELAERLRSGVLGA